MTVAELIAELQKMPPDAPVKIEGYYMETADSESSGAVFTPNTVEALSNEVTGVFAVIWAHNEQ